MTIAATRIAYGTALFRRASVVNIFVRSVLLPSHACTFKVLKCPMHHVLEFEQLVFRSSLLDIRLKNGERGAKQQGEILLR